MHGKLTGLSATHVARLERLYHRKLGPKEVISQELARALTEVARDTSRVVAIMLDRRGNVEHVIVGDATRMYLPDIGRARAGAQRLRGLRMVVVKPVGHRRVSGTHTLKTDTDLITDLEKLRLDAVVVVENRDGLPGRVALSHVLPDEQLDKNGDWVRTTTEEFVSVQALDVDFNFFVGELEAELARKVNSVKDAAPLPGERDQAVIVGAYTTAASIYAPSMAELQELCRTAGVRPMETIVQRRKHLDPRTVVGKGKLEEICLRALHHGCDLIIFDIDLSPSQLNAITDMTDLRVLDRTMLILDIFARRATTRGGKLQVELAQLKYSLPRLQKKQSGMSRLTGGIGGQGPGETKLEVDKRRAQERMTRLDKELKKFANQRVLRRKRRERRDVPTIAIVGYTNAGKSTLLNALTGAEVLAENALFATLDTTSRKLRFPDEREVVMIDTVGFIRDLPKTLVNAFRATLEELTDADLLLHVVDASDPQRDQHIRAVRQVLEDLEVENTPTILVMNKIDALDIESGDSLALRFGGISISAQKKKGFGRLVNGIAKQLWADEIVAGLERWADNEEGERDYPNTPVYAATEDEEDAVLVEKAPVERPLPKPVIARKKKLSYADRLLRD